MKIKTTILTAAFTAIAFGVLLGRSQEKADHQKHTKFDIYPISTTPEWRSTVYNYTGFLLDMRSTREDRELVITNLTPAIRETGIDMRSLPLTIVMSCGNRVTLGKGVTIPTNDIPCPCGDTNHWLWRVEHRSPYEKLRQSPPATKINP